MDACALTVTLKLVTSEGDFVDKKSLGGEGVPDRASLVLSPPHPCLSILSDFFLSSFWNMFFIAWQSMIVESQFGSFKAPLSNPEKLSAMLTKWLVKQAEPDGKSRPSPPAKQSSPKHIPPANQIAPVAVPTAPPIAAQIAAPIAAPTAAPNVAPTAHAWLLGMAPYLFPMEPAEAPWSLFAPAVTRPSIKPLATNSLATNSLAVGPLAAMERERAPPVPMHLPMPAPIPMPVPARTVSATKVGATKVGGAKVGSVAKAAGAIPAMPMPAEYSREVERKHHKHRYLIEACPHGFHCIKEDCPKVHGNQQDQPPKDSRKVPTHPTPAPASTR